jgi:hypothetical protein
VHDQDPQDQPRHREFLRHARTRAKPPRSTVGWGLADNLRLAEEEESVDLRGLDEVQLAVEAKREALRDQRQTRALRRADALLDLRHRAVAMGILILAAFAAATVIAAGLMRGSEGLVHSGLLAFGAIGGAALYRQRLSVDRMVGELRQRRSDEMPSGGETVRDPQG